jgi:site-specific recombinase XerD
MPKAISVYASLRTDKISTRNKKAPIYLRVKIYREEARFPTDLYATKEEWDFTKQLPKKNPLLTTIKNSIAILEQHLLTELATGSEISMQTVRDFFSGKKKVKPEHQSFYTHFLEYIEKVRRDGVVKDTIRIYKGTLNLLQEFRPKLKVSDIDLKLIEDFDIFLRDVHNNADGGRVNKHKNIRSVILHLKKHDIPVKNPYALGFTMPKSKPREIYLEISEVQKLKNAVKSYKRYSIERQALQIFLLACSTGLRISDIESLRFREIDFKQNRIKKIQQKTKNPVSVILTPIAVQAIADFYNHKEGKNPDAFIFKNYSQNALREHLHKIVEEVGIKKTVTFHTARHTFATLKLQGGANPVTISKLLGQKDLKSTAVYTKIDDTLVDIHEQEGGRLFLSTSQKDDSKKPKKKSK